MPSHINHAKGLSGVGKDAEVSEFLSGGAITTGEWVKFDTGKTGEDRANYVVQGAADGLTAGVCLDTVAAGAAATVVRVVTSGYVQGAKTDTNVLLGHTLAAAASGACAPMAAGSEDRAIGLALENDSGTACDVLVFGIR